jgi:quercetin dioxygenase-like cupin family protein
MELNGAIGQTAPVIRSGTALRSVQRLDAKISVLYQRENLEVLSIEIAGGATLAEPSLWAGSSWHLVVEGQPVVQRENQSWELLPGHWLCLDQPGPYRIVNPAPTRAKLVSLVFAREGTDIQQGDEGL